MTHLQTSNHVFELKQLLNSETEP